MIARQSKIQLVRDSVRSALRAGRYIPGERIDTEALAERFKVSVTSVRFALHLLVGGELLEDHVHAGFRVLAPTDRVLRSLYRGMQLLLTDACQMQLLDLRSSKDSKSGGDAVAMTYRLFDNIARATDDPWLCGEIGKANDQLGPVRRMEQILLPQAVLEVTHMHGEWGRRDLRALTEAIVAYHQARIAVAGRIVTLYRTPGHFL